MMFNKRECDQLKTALELQSGDSSKRRSLIVRDCLQWYKEVFSKFQDHGILRLEMGELSQAP